MSRYSERERDTPYLSWITTQQCCVCEKQFSPQFGRTYAHHAGPRGLGQKAPDRTCIPLCWRHHDRNSSTSIHSLGKRFWGVYGLDRNRLILELNQRYELETVDWRVAA